MKSFDALRFWCRPHKYKKSLVTARAGPQSPPADLSRGRKKNLHYSPPKGFPTLGEKKAKNG